MKIMNTNSGPAVVHAAPTEPTAKDILKEKFSEIRAEDAVKNVLQAVSSIGLGAVLGQAACMFMPPQISLPVKACVWVGTHLFGGMLMDRTDDYISKQVDETGEGIRELIGGEDNGEL